MAVLESGQKCCGCFPALISAGNMRFLFLGMRRGSKVSEAPKVSKGPKVLLAQRVTLEIQET